MERYRPSTPGVKTAKAVTSRQDYFDLERAGRQNLGKQARERIKMRFNLDGANSFVRQYEAIYTAVLGR